MHQSFVLNLLNQEMFKHEGKGSHEILKLPMLLNSTIGQETWKSIPSFGEEKSFHAGLRSDRYLMMEEMDGEKAATEQ